MAPGPPFRSLSETDRRFAESRRKAVRRRRAARPASTAGRVGKAIAVAASVFAFAGGIVAEAQGPPARFAQAGPVEGRCPIPKGLRPAFAAAARDTGISLGLLTAIAYEESDMNPQARSHAGAVGLLQLMPGTAAEFDADATNPRENVRAGAAYLARMLELFADDLDLALAAYNAGPTAVARNGGPPSLETVAYVANVKARAFELGNCR